MTYALLCPGQGSQSVGMLRALGATHPQIRETFDEASTTLGWDLRALVEDGPETDLNRTERTQPALLAAGVAVWRAWQASDAASPTLLAGHSLGEYTALVCAGALAFSDALQLVQLRGQLMQQASAGQGAGMAALLGLDEAGVAALCDAYPGPGMLEPANYNAPGQVVVAADADALAWLQEHGKAHGARKVVQLAMSVPSHCSLMRGAAAQLRERLQSVSVQTPRYPVLHNLDAQPRGDANAIRDALAEQLYRPVRWVQTLQAMQARGLRLYLECGPGKVLTGLNKRMVEDGVTLPLEDPASFDQARAQAAASGAAS